jgi:hypothetical protein
VEEKPDMESADAAIFFPDYEDCILGCANVHDQSGIKPHRIVYCGHKIIQKLMADKMSLDEAFEYLDFNIAGAYLGPNTPIIVWAYVDPDEVWYAPGHAPE